MGRAACVYTLVTYVFPRPLCLTGPSISMCACLTHAHATPFQTLAQARESGAAAPGAPPSPSSSVVLLLPSAIMAGASGGSAVELLSPSSSVQLLTPSAILNGGGIPIHPAIQLVRFPPPPLPAGCFGPRRLISVAHVSPLPARTAARAHGPHGFAAHRRARDPPGATWLRARGCSRNWR